MKDILIVLILCTFITLNIMYGLWLNHQYRKWEKRYERGDEK